MPPISEFKCRKCGFSLPSGWGGSFYVIDDSRNRIEPPHPSEFRTVEEILGENPPREVYKARTGFNSDTLCLSCLSQFAMDTDWDERMCPKCGSINVKTIHELIGGPCPRCRVGIIEEIETGALV
jgi:predicted RNA-binding Zn-ribbon protein involved in translation (DUF1610 family)